MVAFEEQQRPLLMQSHLAFGIAMPLGYHAAKPCLTSDARTMAGPVVVRHFLGE